MSVEMIGTIIIVALIVMLWVGPGPKARSRKTKVTDPNAKKPQDWHPPGQRYQPVSGGSGEPKPPPSKE